MPCNCWLFCDCDYSQDEPREKEQIRRDEEKEIETMNTFTRCLNNECQIKGLCKRFHSGRLEHGLAYVCYKPVISKDGTCEQPKCLEFVDGYKPVTT